MKKRFNLLIGLLVFCSYLGCSDYNNSTTNIDEKKETISQENSNSEKEFIDIEKKIREICKAKGITLYQYYSKESENALFRMLRDTILLHSDKFSCGIQNNRIIALCVGPNQTEFKVNGYDLDGERLTIGIKPPTQAYSKYDSVLATQGTKYAVNYYKYSSLNSKFNLPKQAKHEPTIFEDLYCDCIKISDPNVPYPKFTMVYIK